MPQPVYHVTVPSLKASFAFSDDKIEEFSIGLCNDDHSGESVE